MKKYRKKPVVIEAVQFKGDLALGENPMPDEIKNNREVFRLSQSSNLMIKTLEGTMIANRGDWIIKGIKGEFYPLLIEEGSTYSHRCAFLCLTCRAN